MKKDSNSSHQTPRVAEDLELVLEAARRANWDAQRGPAHLRTGRFFISELHEAHTSKPSTAVADADEQRSAS